jgi:hypothetical protein
MAKRRPPVFARARAVSAHVVSAKELSSLIGEYCERGVRSRLQVGRETLLLSEV